MRRRDELIADLQEQLAAARSELAEVRAASAERASFSRHLEAERRLAALGTGLRSKAPRHGAQQKLRAQAIARGQGVAIPTVYATWNRATDITLDALPDRFVLKSAGGASSWGVLPLRRVAGGYEFVSRGSVLDEEGVRAFFTDRTASKGLRPPYFAEEFLRGTTGDDIPLDIKVYAFYGEVGHVMLKRVARHGDLASAAMRYLDANGDDLGDVTPDRAIDHTIPIPVHFNQALNAARALSLAVRLPFVRVDLYETEDGVVFGELTPRPGGMQRYRPEHDRRLGELWEAAQARLDRDIAAGTPFSHHVGE